MKWVKFLWEYYVVRSWVYYFPPKNEQQAPDEDIPDERNYTP